MLKNIEEENQNIILNGKKIQIIILIFYNINLNNLNILSNNFSFQKDLKKNHQFIYNNIKDDELNNKLVEISFKNKFLNKNKNKIINKSFLNVALSSRNYRDLKNVFPFYNNI